MASKKILVVDDDQLVLRSIEILLKKGGYNVVLAQNAQEAIGYCSDQNFDLIISDIRMPGKNGVDAIHEVRRIFDEKIRKDIPIIFITGYAEMSDELNAERLAWRGYLEAF